MTAYCAPTVLRTSRFRIALPQQAVRAIRNRDYRNDSTASRMCSLYALHLSLSVAIPVIQSRLRLSGTNYLRSAFHGGQRWIETLIRQELTPQQIVDYLKRHKRSSLHHETVYGLVYEDKAAGGDLCNHLRVASKPYHKRYAHYDRRGKIKNRVDIDERPAIVESRCRIGDWEGDTVMGKGLKSALLTMVERKTLYTVIMRLTGKQSGLLAEAAVAGLKVLKSNILTITLDNRLEFADHDIIAQGLDADIYFAHPYCSWERGINENTNGLIRQYFPKGTDFNKVSDKLPRSKLTGYLALAC
ncbi:MAG: IS30 family transposase [Candidatus Thiodiazotropha sp. (ex Lucinoma aequizonata)]|nr:IS30 family transposase [Candidatus Thiodiazotropha sp. (ex Lucinoma aequizonata)]